jgi:hypothetical protein
MAVWKSAFYHPFLDGNPQNFSAVPGTLDVVPPLPILPTAVDEAQRGFEIRPGQTMTYRFERPLEEVIGIDLRVDLRFPLQPGIQDFPLVSLGNGQARLSMGHLEFVDPGFTPETGRCRIGFSLDADLVDFSQLVVFHRRMTRFHVRWHTHGQAELSHDGVLRAYQPGFGAGKAFAFDRLTIGGPPNAPAAPTPRFQAQRVYLKVLRRPEARNAIDEHVPLDPCGLGPTQCVRHARGIYDALVTRSRRFMAETLSDLTQPWREGQPGGPFSPDAVRAHAAALAAATALGEFLDRREPDPTPSFLTEIGRFLDILASTNPARYAELLSALAEGEARLDPKCRAEFERIAAANTAALAPLRHLLEATLARARAAAGGGPESGPRGGSHA